MPDWMMITGSKNPHRLLSPCGFILTLLSYKNIIVKASADF
jgi:hypothetical protein